MVRKSIGLAVLVIAIVAFVLTSLTGSTTAAYNPFNPIPYYGYVPALAATGQHYIPAESGVPIWAVPALAAFGSALIVYAGLRLRSRRS